MSTIQPTQHEKNEWSRLAQWAYARSWNDIGHRYSAAASLRHADTMDVRRFDQLQKLYRYWLVFGLSRRMADQFMVEA
jgi:hypothetical protein